MPSEYNEMLVSHSPPVFSHSPPTSFATFHHHHQRTNGFEAFGRVITAAGHYRTTNNNNGLRFTPTAAAAAVAQSVPRPRRPCLVVRSTTEQQFSDDDVPEDDVFSPGRMKKRVVFADDRGMALTQIRVMTEPSNAPPVWSLRFLAQVTQGMSAEPTVVHEPWEITFSQPAAEYLQFRKRLDTLKVSLENVIVKDVEQAIVGTVKVCNIAFDKEVYIRYTVDAWRSHKDRECVYVGHHATSSSVAGGGGSGGSVAGYSLYDTFSFRLDLEADSRNMEFCVCYRCGDAEYWDNNGASNYSVVKKIHRAKYGKMAAAAQGRLGGNKPTAEGDDGKVNLTLKCADIFQAKVESWSEFASWTHLDNNNPYW